MEKRHVTKSVRRPARPEVLGRSRDGVAILNPRSPATHFTDEEVRWVIREVRSGRFKSSSKVLDTPRKAK
jgi:hypothetical protein